MLYPSNYLLNFTYFNKLSVIYIQKTSPNQHTSCTSPECKSKWDKMMVHGHVFHQKLLYLIIHHQMGIHNHAFSHATRVVGHVW
jgi:hypothetical protein